MYKIMYLTVLTICSYGLLSAQTFNKQYTYIDAVQLTDIRRQIDSIDALPKKNNILYVPSPEFRHKLMSILLRYGTEYELLQNPFLGNEVQNMLATHSSQGNEGTEKKEDVGFKNLNIGTNTLSPINLQASMINGVATFMAGRFKQETLHMVIDQMFDQITKKEDIQRIVHSLLPKTYDQIYTLYGNGTYYSADMTLLRQTAKLDIDKLPFSFIQNINLISPEIANNSKLNDVLLLGSHILSHSQEGLSLDDLINSLAEEKYTSNSSSIARLMHTMDLLSQAMKDKTNGHNIWVNRVSLLPPSNSMVLNPKLRYFYGLLYQQLIAIPDIAVVLRGNNSNEAARKIYNLLAFTTKLNSLYNTLRMTNFEIKNPVQLIEYIKNTQATINSLAVSLTQLIGFPQGIGLSDDEIELSDAYMNVVESVVKKDYQNAIPLFIVEFSKYINVDQQKYARSLSFVAQLSSVDNDKDMEKLLESYALPIGSSSIKRHSNFNITLNGYVGLTGGTEIAYGSKENQNKGNIGLAAPIGIATTFAKGRWTAFVSFIDLGSIVNQRLNNDTTSYSNLRLEQFFAPGLGLFFNFKKLPISAGLHYNYIPNLRNIKYEHEGATITETNRNVSRINFSVLVDIPFFTLFNKRKD
ncbi:hypothetical protein ACR78H_07455 [Sphingobacterium siyangense]|uniref:hypothetical protein n=1 Tax=Sphingobacterium siyangense TaxID=459529 RepID=UPI003DA34809